MNRWVCNIDANQAEIVQALERCGCEVENMARAGNGFPDLVVHRRATGLVRFLEVKTKTGKLRPKQEKFAKRFPVIVVRTKEEALRAMEVIR